MFCRVFSIVALGLGLTLTASAAATQQHKSHKPKGAAKPAVQPPPAPAPQEQVAPAPEPPPTPEHGPASPPEVTFRNGQLTIVARNSTLGDVLNQVRSKTGASIDMPASPSSDRVVGQFGPGAPRDVMAQLLNGSHFDYVMVGSPSDPSGLKKIVLTAKMNGPMPGPQQPNNPPVQAYNPGIQAAPQMEQDQQDQPPPDEANTDVQPDVPPQAEQEEPQGEQPGQQPNPNGGPVVKTPEQLLRELQQQQQQQQQNQQPPQQ